MFEHVVVLAFPAAMAFAGAMDLLTMTIPNRVSIAIAATFLAAAIVVGLPAEQILWHVGAGALMLAVGILFFAAGWLGGGDAKLLAAAALWIGFNDLVAYLALVSVLGGVLALAILGFRRLPVAAFPCPDWVLRLHGRGTGIPYGLAIAGGALWIYPTTQWFAALVS